MLLKRRLAGLKFHKSTTCALRPQEFSFKLPMVLKTDFET